MLVLRFDTESANAMAPANYRTSVPRPGWLDEAVRAVSAVRGALDDMEARASFFVVGQLLKLAGAEYAEQLGGNPRFDIGNHTFNHWKIWQPEGPPLTERFGQELARTEDLVERHFGARPRGFTAPGAYYRGLQGRPSQLAVLAQRGYAYVTCDGQPSPDRPRGSPAPMTQPYWYGADGFPDLLELPLTGWHCNLLFNSGGQNDDWQPAPGFPDGALLEKLPRTPEAGFEVRRREFAFAIEHNLIYAPCMHPWSIYRADPEMRHLRRLIEMARERDVPVVNCRDVYEVARDTRVRQRQPGLDSVP